MPCNRLKPGLHILVMTLWAAVQKRARTIQAIGNVWMEHVSILTILMYAIAAIVCTSIQKVAGIVGTFQSHPNDRNDNMEIVQGDNMPLVPQKTPLYNSVSLKY